MCSVCFLKPLGKDFFENRISSGFTNMHVHLLRFAHWRVWEGRLSETESMNISPTQMSVATK